jgi:hypothetical protein
MAATGETTYKCGLCGARGFSKRQLRNLGLLPIFEKPALPLALAKIVVCPDCRARPINDLLTVLEPMDAERRRALQRHWQERPPRRPPRLLPPAPGAPPD